MSSKTTPNWSQRIEEKRPSSVVYTRKNTTFEQWVDMVREELVARSMADFKLNMLSAKHAWEGDATPKSYAYILWQREVRADDKRCNP